MLGLSATTTTAGATKVALRTNSVPATASPQTSGATPRFAKALKWPEIILESELAVGQSAQFTFGAGSKWAGKAGAVYRESKTTFKVFDLICTHMGCTAVPHGAQALCPCHHSTYSLVTGAATGGPAQQMNTGSLTGSKVAIVKGAVRWVADL